LTNLDAQRAFDALVEQQISQFPHSRLAQRVEAGDVTLTHYHTLLCTLFHQTYSGPFTFARAAVNCSWTYERAKEYLLQHAEEERTHWRWVLDDLRVTGYAGTNPRELPPHPSCQAYIGLNYYIAEQAPVARLAIASVLEGIGAAHGGTYGGMLLQSLGLRKEHASFFLSHSETDKVHAVELHEVIAGSPLTSADWRWMNHAAECAGLFYRAMYDHQGYD
jgi:hypothetical protein